MQTLFSDDKCWRNVGRNIKVERNGDPLDSAGENKNVTWPGAKPTQRAASEGMWVRGREDHFYFREFAGEALMFPV